MSKYFLIFSTLIIIVSCRKDDSININETSKNDYRENFVGDYSFEMIYRFWYSGQPDSYDTSFVSGYVKIYEHGDFENNLYADQETSDTSRVITIYFSQNHITSRVNEDGSLIVKNGPHYLHEGYFIADSLHLDITHLGGLGAGYDYFLRGKKM